MRAQLVALLIGSALLPACDGGGVNCTTEARASVTISVVGLGSTQDQGHVQYSLDGGPLQDTECIYATPAQCSSWVAGWEQAGTFRIVATTKDGTKTAEQTVVVTQGECHVNGQTVTLTIE